MRIFQPGLYLSLDYNSGKARKLQIDKGRSFDPTNLSPETFELDKGDPLLEEIKSFITVIRQGVKPIVNAKDGLNAMRVALQIRKKF